MHDSAHIQFLQIGVLLAHSHVQDGFGGGVDQREGSAHLVINGVKLRQQNGIDLWLEGLCGLLEQGIVELGDLVHCIVAHQCLTNKYHQVGLVHLHQSGQFLHEWGVVLHASSSVHQDCVDVLARGLSGGGGTSLMA